MRRPKKKKIRQWHPVFFAGLQIELEEDADNMSFENPLKDAKEAEKLIGIYSKNKENCLYESVMNMIIRENKEKFEEVNVMCEALEEIFKDKLEEREREAKERWKAEAKEKWETEGELRVNRLIQLLVADSRLEEIERAVTDRDFQNGLFEEFGL